MGAAANVFVGMVEAPLLVRPYLATLSRSELFAVMTCGMATVAGTVLVLYASFIGGVIPDALGHILTASLISVPAALMVARLMGIPWAEARNAGSLMGVKTVLNELLAYLQMANLPQDALSPRSQLIMTYALCGFANFGSLGIMMGGLNTMVPERREEIVGLGMKSMVSGTIATCMTGAMVGIMTTFPVG